MWNWWRILAASSFSSSELHKVWPPCLFLGTIFIKCSKTQICLWYMNSSAACLTLQFLDELLERYWCISALYDCTVCGLCVPKLQSVALINLKNLTKCFKHMISKRKIFSISHSGPVQLQWHEFSFIDMKQRLLSPAVYQEWIRSPAQLSTSNLTDDERKCSWLHNIYLNPDIHLRKNLNIHCICLP